MWTFLPSITSRADSGAGDQKFFSYDEVLRAATNAGVTTPVVRSKVWGGDERSQGWAIECETFAEFERSLLGLCPSIEFLAFDESNLDEDIIRYVHDDLRRFAHEEGLSNELVVKAASALRSRQGERFATVAYAFLKSGHVLFVRAQTELARFISQPDRLLTAEGLAAVRKFNAVFHANENPLLE